MRVLLRLTRGADKELHSALHVCLLNTFPANSPQASTLMTCVAYRYNILGILARDSTPSRREGRTCRAAVRIMGETSCAWVAPGSRARKPMLNVGAPDGTDSGNRR